MSKDIQHIINSGDVELYVLGAMESERVAEFEVLISQHPALAQEVETTRRTLEGYSAAYSVNPAPKLRATILGNALASSQESTNKLTILRLPELQRYKRYAIAASVLFAISTTTAVYYRIQSGNLAQTLSTTQQELAAIQKDNSVMAAKFDMLDKRRSMMNNSAVKPVLMMPVPNMPQTSRSLVLWDTATQKVYLDVQALPTNQPDTDYQLWALVDGKPIDLGVFNTNDKNPLYEMKSIAKADAFAVTLEPKGGSTTPTLSKMYIMAKV